MDDSKAAERGLGEAVLAMIPLAEGRHAVHVNRHDGSVFVSRRVGDLRLAPEESTSFGECDWVSTFVVTNAPARTEGRLS